MKLHVKLDYAGYLPTFAPITTGKVHEQFNYIKIIIKNIYSIQYYKLFIPFLHAILLLVFFCL